MCIQIGNECCKSRVNASSGSQTLLYSTITWEAFKDPDAQVSPPRQLSQKEYLETEARHRIFQRVIGNSSECEGGEAPG